MTLRSLLATLSIITVAACGGSSDTPKAEVIALDGSSTVFPISEAMAEEFQIQNAGMPVTVGVSGTGGGFKKFCRAETVISNASRPISASEIAECTAAGIHRAGDGVTPMGAGEERSALPPLQRFQPEAS